MRGSLHIHLNYQCRQFRGQRAELCVSDLGGALDRGFIGDDGWTCFEFQWLQECIKIHRTRYPESPFYSVLT